MTVHSDSILLLRFVDSVRMASESAPASHTSAARRPLCSDPHRIEHPRCVVRDSGLWHTMYDMDSDRRHVLTVRATDAELERLDEFAARLELSRSEAVRQLLRVGLAAVEEARTHTNVLALLSSLGKDKRPKRKKR